MEEYIAEQRLSKHRRKRKLIDEDVIFCKRLMILIISICLSVTVLSIFATIYAAVALDVFSTIGFAVTSIIFGCLPIFIYRILK